MRFKFFCLISLLFLALAEAKPPELTPKDAKRKIEEILKAHVTQKAITPEIAERALINFLEELDYTKTYLIDNEIDKWICPTEETLIGICKEIKNESFKTFEQIYALMLKAIDRRSNIEAKIIGSSTINPVDAEELRDINWAKSYEELEERIIKIRALQLDAAESLNDETKEQFFQRLTKRRQYREHEIVLESSSEQTKQMLAYVLKAVSSALDSHTAYFTPTEASQFMIQVQQRLFGIGAQLRDDLNGFSIVRLLDGGPATVSGKLKVGDRIIAVNNTPVVGLDIVEAVELIRGPQGSSVNVTILRSSNCDQETNSEIVKTLEYEKISVDIVRDEIVLKETRIESKVEPFGDRVIAHIHLFSFYQDPNSSSARDVEQAIEAIKKEHTLAGVILDLRNNAGGLLPQAVSVAGLFITKGIIVSIKDSTGKIQHLRNFAAEPVWTGPLIVLTNRTSASSAEIVAQSLQDYGRAILVGDDHTFGKGSYQSFTLESSNHPQINPQGEYKVTRGMYYTVSGITPQRHGAKANIEVPGLYSTSDIGESFAKFPLEGDLIPPNFDDTLADIHPLHRGKMKRTYKTHLQVKLDTYTKYLPKLIVNSKERISSNTSYQNFLSIIKNPESISKSIDEIDKNDLQLDETFSIMKDLIFFMNQTDVIPNKAA